MSFKITGVIRELESNDGVPDLKIRAFDKDIVFDDILGSAVTDSNGNFDITYEERNFRQLFEGKPDIYITVSAKDDRTIYTTEKEVRLEAGKTEHFDIRIPKSIIEGEYTNAVGIRFSRSMSGFFLENTDDFQQGLKVGGKRRNRIQIRCRVTISDLDRFINEPDHPAQMDGQIDFGDLGKNLRMQNGVFNLFKIDPIGSKRKAIYRFHFDSKSGQPYLFIGEKEIHRDQSSTEMLKDMTTLYTRIHHGDSQAGGISGSGILSFQAKAFPEVFGSLEVLNASNNLERIGAISMFYGFVYKELEHIYLNFL